MEFATQLESIFAACLAHAWQIIFALILSGAITVFQLCKRELSR